MAFVTSIGGLAQHVLGRERPSRARSVRTPRCVASAPAGSEEPKFVKWLVELEKQTRPGGTTVANELLKERYDGLPEHVKTPNQMLGRVSPGCEGTQGVFPRCTFGCKPCYHSKDANKVRIDGMHTLIEVSRQMDVLKELRGPHGHCQLIGGEVSLLPAEDHAMVLETMRQYGRVPMSFTHGDFSYDYLKKLSVKDDGRRRFKRLDFAVHFDRFMVGRTGAKFPQSEAELNPFRRRFVAMFERLRREHHINYYIAHNMTVQPGNLSEVSEVLRENLDAGFRMFSFQPAAFQGDPKRWTDNYTRIAEDDGSVVWAEIEKGVGARLPYNVLQMGDVRCNRMCLGFLVGKGQSRRYVPLLDDQEPGDVTIRDEFLEKFGSFVMPMGPLILKLARHMLKKPIYWVWFAKWAARFVRKAGGIFNLARGVRFFTIVMHRFMDAENVKIAWDLLDRDIVATEPKIRETQERLQACSYAMAQPGERRVVPACVQHSIYDPENNMALRELLPMDQPARAARDALKVDSEEPSPAEKLLENANT